MKLLLNNARKSYLLNNDGYSLAEAIFVVMLISILSIIAVPILEGPFKTSIQTIKKYSETGFISGRKGGEIVKKIRLLALKISIRSYIFSAKEFYLINSTLPKNVGDLKKFGRVSGCQIKEKQNLLREKAPCKQLDNNSSVSSWESSDRFYLIKMFSKSSRLNILAIPHMDGEKGISACYNNSTGGVQIKTMTRNDSKIRTIKC